MQFVDFELAQRIEAFEAESGRACTEAAAAREPEVGAAWIAVGGGWAAFTGKDSPITQAVGLGMAGAVEEAEIARMEDFYRSRGAATNIETCPLAHPSLFEALGQRGYRVVEFSNVLYRGIEAGETFARAPEGVSLHRAGNDERAFWAETVARGFADEIPLSPELVSVLSAFANRPGAQLWLAEVDGEVAGGAAVAIDGGMAGLFGAATLPSFRGRGVQGAFFAARLAEAARAGATMAYTIALPGSGSHRNAERAGFRVAYTRVKFMLAGE
jgi:GNAT superfamily N-acetyltransferase